MTTFIFLKKTPFYIHLQLVFNEACKFQIFINEILRFKHIMSRKDKNAPDIIRLKYNFGFQ